MNGRDHKLDKCYVKPTSELLQNCYFTIYTLFHSGSWLHRFPSRWYVCYSTCVSMCNTSTVTDFPSLCVAKKWLCFVLVLKRATKGNKTQSQRRDYEHTKNDLKPRSRFVYISAWMLLLIWGWLTKYKIVSRAKARGRRVKTDMKTQWHADMYTSMMHPDTCLPCTLVQ